MMTLSSIPQEPFDPSKVETARKEIANLRINKANSEVIYSENKEKVNEYIKTHNFYDARPFNNFAKLSQKEKSLENLSIAYQSFNTPSGQYEHLVRQCIFTGKYKQHPQTLYATLHFPEAPNQQKWPAIILSPGATSLSLIRKTQDKLIQFCRRLGIVCLIMDHYTSREIDKLTYDQFRLSIGASTIDAFQGLKLLSTHPNIDSDAIAIGGFSRGAEVVEFTTRLEYQTTLSPKLKFAAHLEYYPLVFAQEKIPRLTGAPIIYFIGDKDDLTSPNLTLNHVERLQNMGYRNVTVKIYKDAFHGMNVEEFKETIFSINGLAVIIFNKLYDCHLLLKRSHPWFCKFFDLLANVLAWPLGEKGFHKIQNFENCGYRYDETGFYPLNDLFQEQPKQNWEEFSSFIISRVTEGGHLRGSNLADRDSLRDTENFIKAYLLPK